MHLPDMTDEIPHRIPITVLNRLFDDTTTSYKYFFFLGLLDWFDPLISPLSSSDHTSPILFSWIAHRMAIHAWDPVVYYGLSLGRTDTLSKPLTTIRQRMTASGDRFTMSPEKALHQYRDPVLDKELMKKAQRHVPYRLIRVFYSQETYGLQDAKVNAAIEKLSKEDALGRSPYTINSKTHSLQIRKPWAEFFQLHLQLLRDWTRWHLVQYLNRKNPMTTGVPSKLKRIDKGSLTNQRKILQWWLKNSQHPLSCFYTGQVLNAKSFALDHFLPHVYVVHDQLWNLLPADSSVNSRKGAMIPDESYVQEAGKFQYSLFQLLHLHSEAFPAPWFTDFYMEYQDVVLPDYPEDQPIHEDQFVEAYSRLVTPFIRNASRYGLQTGWIARPA